MSRRGSDRGSRDFAVGFCAKNWISMEFIRWVILSPAVVVRPISRVHNPSRSRACLSWSGVSVPPLAAHFVCHRGFHAIGLVFGGYVVFGAERPTEMGVGSGF